MKEKKKIYIIDDWPETLAFLANDLVKAGFITETFETAKEAIKRLGEVKPDIILVDFNMPEINGLDFIKLLPSIAPEVPAILMTGVQDNLTSIVVEAIKNNAVNFIQKSDKIDLIIEKINQAIKSYEVKENDFFKSEEVRNRFGFIGASPAIQNLCKAIERIAATDYPVLLVGETGTGKELVAKAIHLLSKRKEEVFLAVNCGTIVDTLAESELFGHVKGAFTGAIKDKPGIFKLAEKGSLYLDEISEANTTLQVKLLRALDPGEFSPVGGTSEPVKTRIIASTNRKISTKNPGVMRQDLVFRFEAGILYIPSLNERKEDIPLLANYFLLQEKQLNQNNYKLFFTNDALEYMSKMHWEGNVRELRSFVRRIFLASKDEEISCKTIIDFLKNQSNIQSNIIKEASQEEILNFILSFKDEILDKGAEVFIENLKQKMYKYFLEECQGNKAETARILKIEKSTFRKALERLGM